MSQITSSHSVYQIRGKPLSEEAIYKAKLKYGVYNNPSKVNLGVDPSAADNAALLASSTDLSIHPYKRELASDAATAALIAKTDSAPKAWKRNSFAPEAEFAAISAKSTSFPHNNINATTDSLDESEEFEAASSASSVLRNDKYLAKNALQDLYDFDDIRSGKATLSNNMNFKSSIPKNTINSKAAQSAYNHSNTYDISNISKLSTSSALKSINSRINPDKLDYRSGLVTSNHYNSANGQVDISKITFSAEKSARESVQKRINSKTPNYGIPTASTSSINESFASVGALASQNIDTGFDYAAKERSTLIKNTLVDKKVLLKALENANNTLTKIDGDISIDSIFKNKEMNLKAMQIAQENLAKRQANDISGKINLGGGLLLTPGELTAMAEKLVQPILQDIDAKVETQRNLDVSKAKQQAELKQKKIEFKEAERQKKIADKLEKEKAKQARLTKLQNDKNALLDDQQQKADAKQKELDEIKKSLEEQIAAEEEAKKEIETERSEKLVVIQKAKEEKDAVRQAELDKIQEEKDEIAKPILEELEVENGKLAELTAKREEVEGIYNDETKRLEAATSETEELTKKIEELDSKIAELTTILETKREEASKALAESEQIKKEAEDKHNELHPQTEELNNKRTTLLTQIDEANTEREAKLSELHEEKQKALDEEVEINGILPEHLQKDLPDNISMESSLNVDEFAESSFKEEELEPEEPEVGAKEEYEEGSSEGTVKKSATPVARPSVPKKTWDEIRELGAGGDDPLKNVPTNEKPSMTDIVTEDDVRASQAKKLTPTEKKDTKSAAAAARSSGSSSSATPKKSGGFFKKLLSSSSSSSSTPAAAPVAKKTYPKKKTVTDGTSSSTPAVVVEKSEASEIPVPAETEAKTETEPATTETETEAKKEESDLFSNFSQGSEVEVEEKK